MGLWNLQVFIICCTAPRHVALLGKLLDIDVRRKSDSKILQILLAKQKNSFGKCLRAFFRIISTFELDRKLATIMLFSIGIPKQWGCKFRLYFMCSKTSKP